MTRIAELGYETPVFATPKGVSPDLLERAREISESMAKYPNLEGTLVILLLGRLHSKTGLVILARSYVKISPKRKDCALPVAGPDEESSRKQMESFLTEDALDRTVVTGMLTGRDKRWRRAFPLSSPDSATFLKCPSAPRGSSSSRMSRR